jgi:hypothetical protein
MDHISLADMQLGPCDKPVCVRVCRLWEFRGGIHCGSVKLLHMVLSDIQVSIFHFSFYPVLAGQLYECTGSDACSYLLLRYTVGGLSLHVHSLFCGTAATHTKHGGYTIDDSF